MRHARCDSASPGGRTAATPGTAKLDLERHLPVGTSSPSDLTRCQARQVTRSSKVAVFNIQETDALAYWSRWQEIEHRVAAAYEVTTAVPL